MTDTIISKVWSFCLRRVKSSTMKLNTYNYGDDLEQLTYPIFLTMADE